MIAQLPINYSLIGKAVDFYKNIGYELINVDWMVAPPYSYATWSTPGAQFRTVNSKGYAQHLVGSAEQGFIQKVALKQVDHDKKYVSVTPCFRRGDNTTPVNTEWFMKVELSAVSHDTSAVFHHTFLDDAWACFDYLGADYTKMKVWVDDKLPNKDINYEFPELTEWPWLELGSYGYRELVLSPKDLQKSNCVIHYGTGLALPRFQLIL